MSPKLNLSKIQSFAIEAAGGGFVVQVVYRSGQKRGFTFGNDETGLDALVADALKAGVSVTTLDGQTHTAQPQAPAHKTPTPWS